MREVQLRGIISQRIKEKSKELLGYEISQEELRLFNHLVYVLCNSQRLEYRKVNPDLEDLKTYRQRGWITAGITQGKGRIMVGEKLRVTKDFWNAMNEIVWLGYVDLG